MDQKKFFPVCVAGCVCMEALKGHVKFLKAVCVSPN